MAKETVQIYVPLDFNSELAQLVNQDFISFSSTLKLASLDI